MHESMVSTVYINTHCISNDRFRGCIAAFVCNNHQQQQGDAAVQHFMLIAMADFQNIVYLIVGWQVDPLDEKVGQIEIVQMGAHVIRQWFATEGEW